MIYVAKSYQELPQIGDIFSSNGKQYIKVKLKSGNEKIVRVYSEKEYQKLYPAEAKPAVDKSNPKVALGFLEAGYITIYKGDTYSNLNYFKTSKVCRYNSLWGWYTASNEELPEDLPEGIEPIKLFWENISENSQLKSNEIIKKHIDSLIYESGTSKWQGSIKERITKEVTVIRNIHLDSIYGSSTLHIMEDAEGNLYSWTTTTKSWAEGSKRKIKGTVIAHETYRNQNQTKLSRCVEII